MILQIRRRAKRRSILLLCILTALAAICIALCFNDLVTLINGPELLTKDELLNADNYEGKYVTVQDASMCGEFAIETRVSARSLIEKKFCYYLCRDHKSKEADAVFFAIRISGKDQLHHEIPVVSENMLSYAPSYSATGTLHKLNAQAVPYYNLLLNKIEEFENTYQAVPYYIDDGYINGLPIVYPIAIAVLALVLLAIALFVFMRYIRMSELSGLVHEIYQNPEDKLTDLECEYNQAKTFGENMKISKNYMFWHTGIKEKIVPLTLVKKVVFPVKNRSNGITKIKIILKNDKKLHFCIPEELSKDIEDCLSLSE